LPISSDNLKGLLFLPAEPNWTKVVGRSSGGLFVLPSSVRNGPKIKGLAERRSESLILPSRVRTHKIEQSPLFAWILLLEQEISLFWRTRLSIIDLEKTISSKLTANILVNLALDT